MNRLFILCNCVIVVLLFESIHAGGDDSKSKPESSYLVEVTQFMEKSYETAKKWLNKLKENLQEALKWFSKKICSILEKLFPSRKQIYEIQSVTGAKSFGQISAVSFRTTDKEKAKLIVFWKFEEVEKQDSKPLLTLEAKKIYMDEYLSAVVNLTYDKKDKYKITFKNAQHAERFRNFLPYKSKSHL